MKEKVKRDNSELPRRKSIRLEYYDYSQPGIYFVTICTRKKECLFGEVMQGKMNLNEAGKIVNHIWTKLPERFKYLELGDFVIMPNHIHGIIVLSGSNYRLPEAGAASGAPTLGDIIRAFKSISAIRLNRLLDRTGKQFWQRNYYEHVIRNDEDLSQIRSYIVQNPLKWELDRENPEKIGRLEWDNSIFGY